MNKCAFLLLMVSSLLQAQNLKVMTYNLRVDFGGDGENNWSFRRDFLAKQIAFYEPDFIGTQEGLAHQLHFIDSTLVHYEFIGLSRDDSKTKGEFSAIFYNTDKFKLISESTFWLSETPQLKSKGWDAALERICTYGRFEEVKTKRQFFVFNTHFDHIGEVARTNSAKLIIAKIKAINTDNLPIVLTGDFNAASNSEAYHHIADYLNDTRRISKTTPFGPEGTFNNFEFHKPVTIRIDYIFASRNQVEVVKHATLSDSKDCKYPSDHLPVYTEIHLK